VAVLKGLITMDLSTLNLVYKNNNESRAVRIIVQDDEPWFVLADVCAALNIANSANVAARLDDDEKGTHSLDTPGGTQTLTIISEAGFYSAILGARKNPRTKPFKDWVTRDVLPTIRKTGGYIAKPTPITPAQLTLQMAQTLVGLESRQEQLEYRMDNQPISGTRKGQIHKLGQKLGRAVGNYSKGWRIFNEKFGLAGYGDLEDCRFDEAVRFLELQIAAYTGESQDSFLEKERAA
jgi:prophage antirepressor-like protein